MSRFEPANAFGGTGYRLLPLRFRRLPWDPERVFVTSLGGDWLIIGFDVLQAAVNGTLPIEHPAFMDFEARHMVVADAERASLAPLLAQIRTRKRYLTEGPALHIFVVSLRCHHTCNYCQVSRQPTGASNFDLEASAAEHAVERLFEWPSRTLTVEFQGGEPLLHFGRIRTIVDAIVRRNRTEGRAVRFVLASTLHDITDAQLAFFHEHGFCLSTSLDGPEWLHNANRPRPERDSYRRTIEGIERARRALGDDAVSALTTLTRRSLEAPEEIIEAYRTHGFHTISLRPLSPYGFARTGERRQGYPIRDFLGFYRRALAYLLEVNRSGYLLEETTASLLLSQLLTPFGHGYVDLRSPTGAGLGAVVYDYDGWVYPSDEARMLASMGNRRFALGRVEESVESWLASPVMNEILASGVAEALPTCADCAFVPLCGADPIDHYARQGDLVGHRPTSDFCARHMGLFDLLLETWETGTSSTRSTLRSWATHSEVVDLAADVVA